MGRRVGSSDPAFFIYYLEKLFDLVKSLLICKRL